MSNTEPAPAEVRCQTSSRPSRRGEVLDFRAVPLGGPRAMTVRRTLPQRRRSLIGAWCFADHFGPDEQAAPSRMDVPPHPHTGLQTVTWLFDGDVEHRDSLGTAIRVRPGEVNLMTAGHGICHSEVSIGAGVLRGVQLWVALPNADRDRPPDFAHHAPGPVDIGAATLRVLIGSVLGVTSPVEAFTPVLGAQLDIPPGAGVELPVESSFEHGVLVDQGSIAVADTPAAGTPVADTPVAPGQLAYVGPGPERLVLANRGESPGRVMVLGGEPFGEEIIMWWNFIGRSHEEIAAFRDEWEAESERFGSVDGYRGATPRLPAPALPNARLRPRANPS